MPEIPEGAKVPEDRQSKTDPNAPTTIELEIAGVPVSLDPNALDDFEVADKIGRVIEASNGSGEPQDMLLAGQLLRQLVGGETFRKLMHAHRDPDTGRVSVEQGALILSEVLGAVPN